MTQILDNLQNKRVHTKRNEKPRLQTKQKKPYKKQKIRNELLILQKKYQKKKHKHIFYVKQK